MCQNLARFLCWENGSKALEKTVPHFMSGMFLNSRLIIYSRLFPVMHSKIILSQALTSSYLLFPSKQYKQYFLIMSLLRNPFIHIRFIIRKGTNSNLKERIIAQKVYTCWAKSYFGGKNLNAETGRRIKPQISQKLLDWVEIKTFLSSSNNLCFNFFVRHFQYWNSTYPIAKLKCHSIAGF